MDITDDTVIEARGLSCSYGDFVAVRDLDLTVHRGELFALLGTNGAGKTTTMETLEGHRGADGGQVRVLGLDPQRDRAALRPRIGMMLQETGFAGDLTVRETLEMWAALTTRPDPVDDVLKRVELADRADTRVVQLSGGQRRRLDLALATLNRPEVLFLDEPTAGLDPESRERTWGIVRDLLAGGTTVVLTTHYLEEAESLADRIAIMHGGRVVREGTLEQIVGAAPAQISFRAPVADGARLERELRTVVDPQDVQVQGDLVRLGVADLQPALGRLLGWADQHGHRLGRLHAQEASLSEVFTRISQDRIEENA
ncbi:ATP-binding cassette domain-containing protein [Aeromicrobium sp. 636]|uniref:ABC transporter ATP-binding protein n=1 Tax=Aeromicrobium senzhongii TaxID=2663859 RepID=A0A8I0EWY9_9ACTN|nr:MULTISPECIES: ABC transporter ATP-binding protein [Aeromicrobium]MBC9227059.1 ABC transporter ATP-binding protein [Aeromicrobium senzhongii]MCQ3999159.1 ATP-binding cassette domain-containing protein [Aeromicrobium sp. 636]